MSFAVAGPDSKGSAKKKANEVVTSGWVKRCDGGTKAKKRFCEVFQRLSMKGTDKRLAEFAVGFVPGKWAKEAGAQGVIVLPLGMLLEPGAAMKGDDGKSLTFKSSYCTKAGCFFYVNVDKDLLGFMKKGKAITLSLKAANGKSVNVPVTLSGFEKALKEV